MLTKTKHKSRKPKQSRYIHIVNGSPNNDFDALRTSYVAQIQELQRKIDQLDTLANDHCTLTIHARDKYRDVGLRESVLDAVKSLAPLHPDGVTAIQVTRFIQEHGYVKKDAANNLYITVHVTIGRNASLNKNTPLRISVETGKRLYKPNNNFKGTVGGL
jgi:hypothetical protein